MKMNLLTYLKLPCTAWKTRDYYTVLTEAQCGNYLEENGIVRYEDEFR
jgi:hypothetical protein